MRTRTALVALLLLFLAQAAEAQQLYIRNKPFKGATVGKGDSMLVELEPLAVALGLAVSPLGEGWAVAVADEALAAEATTPAGTVLVNGQSVPVQDQGGTHLVNLREFCRAAGARVVPNPALGTVDVYQATTMSLGSDDFSNVPTKVGPDATPTQVVRAYFGAFRLLDGLPAAGDGTALVAFMRSPQRFIHSIDLCTDTLKPLVTPDFFQDWKQRSGKLRSTLSEGPKIFSRLKASDRARAAQALEEDEEFQRFWASVNRLWDALRYSKVKILGESIAGDSAVVDVEVTLGSLGTAPGRVELVRQDGRWKITRAPGAAKQQ